MHMIVTGAAGFIGYRLCQKLKSLGHEITAVDRLAHFESRKREHTESPWDRQIDREKFLAEFYKSSHKTDAVFHMGACTRTTELDEAYLRKVNLDYSKSLLEICTQIKVPLIYASSAATYGAGENGYDDDEIKTNLLKPLNPYGESKLQFDQYLLGLEKKGSPLPPSWAGFKFFNVYGYGERHKSSMASVVLHSFDQIQKNGTVQLFESHRPDFAHGHQKRDFIFVDDLIDVLIFALNKPILRGIYNLGTGEARTFLDLVRATFRATQKPESIRFVPTPESIRERYQYFTEAKMDKLRKQGYSHPFTSLEDGVLQYVKLLEKNRDSS